MEYSSQPKWVLTRNEHGTLTVGMIPFILLQLTVLLLFTTHFSWAGLAVCAVSYAVRMFAITGFYHRYFSHRTFKMGRVMQFLAGLLGASATQKGVLWWAAHHRRHHKESDTPEDPHSSREGFFHSHWMWFLYEENGPVEYDRIPDLVKFPELRLLNRFWLLVPISMSIGLFLWGGWHMVVWGYFVSTFLLSNATYTINSLMHYWGKQQFFTGDDSRNHWLLAALTLGEGWHNNHHRYQASTRNGFFWYEFDITYYILKLMSLFGLVRGLTPVPEKILEEGRLNLRLRQEAEREGLPFVPSRVRRRDLRDSAEGILGDTVRRVREEMQNFGEQVTERCQQLRVEFRGMKAQSAGVGNGLLAEIQSLSEEVAERGKRLRGEIEALSIQLTEQRQQLGSEVQLLLTQAQELSQQLSDRGRQLRLEAQNIGEQVVETARQQLAEVQELGEQLAARGRQLRTDLEELGGGTPEFA